MMRILTYMIYPPIKQFIYKYMKRNNMLLNLLPIRLFLYNKLNLEKFF